jgi:transposase
MEGYHNFVGIDIGKNSFVVYGQGNKDTDEFENSTVGIGLFLESYAEQLTHALSVVETTGGYEIALIYTLIEKGYDVHRADARKVKNFIRSYAGSAKTDKLDAKALSKYGKERKEELELFKIKNKKSLQLFQLVQRRSDLKQILVAEKNRAQSPSSQHVTESILKMIKVVESQLEEITKAIKELIESDEALKTKQQTLKTIPGIGEIVSSELMILLPELGTLSRKKIASLAGLAPRNNDSGRYSGYRRTGHGRVGVKPMLYLSAMSARNSKSDLKTYYEKLVSKGKPKKVALTALMRKILVIANARVKEINLN